MNAPTNRNPARPIKLYRSPVSGHSHRVELFLSLLGLPVEIININLQAGEQKTPEFLQMNPFGQVPVIQDGEITLSDSNGILVYLAGKYSDGRWLPRDPAQAAEVQRWLSAAAGWAAFGPAAARAVKLFKAPFNLDEVTGRAQRLLGVMEKVLLKSPYLAGAAPTLADIANYTYIVLAPEGGVSLAPYPQVRAWLASIEALPGFIPMTKTPATTP
ncbi:MAG: glutathione S-transferase family protein [Betaproteobacteria bacterium]|nr:glutathione S-transferase family protein [Betaproteobacteria bacterium]